MAPACASLPFYFQTRGIEFACGACLSHDGEELLIAYGIDDAEAWLCRLPLSAARALLQPLPVDADASSFL